jgi:two-component system, cell cycle response regulator DivK
MIPKVLVIEDVYANRYMLIYLMRREGWHVAEAEDGKSALATAAEFLPDLILLDIGLPGGVNGYELVHLLRAIPTLQQVPIIAVTSYAMGGDRETALQAGCTDYIEKPIDAITFIAQVKSVLDRSLPE